MGEVIDLAVALTLRHFRPLFLAMLVIELPAFALYRLFAAEGQRAVAELIERPTAPPESLPALVAGSLGMLVLLVFLQLCASSVAAALVAPSLEGREGDHPWRPVASHAGAILGAAAAQLSVLALAPALGAVPGALLAWRAVAPATRVVGLAAALAGAVALLLAAVLRFALAAPAAAVEGVGGASALRRSARLMAPGRGLPLRERPGLRVSILLLATFLLGIAVNGLVGLPRGLAGLATGHGAAAAVGAPLPLPLEIVLGLFEAAANAAVQPFALVALAVFYFDRRARVEALDLELWADRMTLEADR